ncbi:MAG: hypothetical protein E6Q32_07265 [Neisseriales bacterium]|nr:MAG: hypothetical protein E6Q32_07265 [Neisseriales bacterium]
MNNEIGVTFETKCWEQDWEFLLKTNYLQEMINRNQFDFAQKNLFINNVENLELVKFYADKKIKEGVIDKYYVVADYAEEVLSFFGLNQEDFAGGYYYSIAELTSIYLCQTEFLLHYSSDAILSKNFNWIDDAIEVLNNSKKIVVVNPCWNHRYKEAKRESFEESNKFYVGYGFSDQAYLIRVNDFRRNIYNEVNEFSSRYPKYGGELFEKRVDSWMRNHQFYRVTHREVSYIHQNFPKNKLLRLLKLWKWKK